MTITISNRTPVVVAPSSTPAVTRVDTHLSAATRAVSNVGAAPSNTISVERADQMVRKAITSVGAPPASVDEPDAAASATAKTLTVAQLERRSQLYWDALIRREIDKRRASYHDALLKLVANQEKIVSAQVATQYPNMTYLGVNWKTYKLEYYDPRFLLGKTLSIKFDTPEILDIVRILKATDGNGAEGPNVARWDKPTLVALCNAPPSLGQTSFLPARLQMLNLQEAHAEWLRAFGINDGQDWALAPGQRISASVSEDTQVLIVNVKDTTKSRVVDVSPMVRQAYAQFQSHVDQQLSQIALSLQPVDGKLQPIAGGSDDDMVAGYQAVLALNLLKQTFADSGVRQLPQALLQAIADSKVNGVAGIRDWLGTVKWSLDSGAQTPAPGASGAPSASGAAQTVSPGEAMVVVIDTNTPVTQTLLEAGKASAKLGSALGKAAVLVSAVRFGLSLKAYLDAPQAERAKAMSALLSDSVALGLGVTSLAGGTTVGAAAGWLAVPAAGVGFGVTALVDHFSKTAAGADLWGAEIEKMYQNIKLGGVFIDKDGVLRVRPGVVIKKLDLKNGTVTFSPVWTYGTTPSTFNQVGGPDYKNKIDLIERLGLWKEMYLPKGALNATAVELPPYLMVTYDYRYVVLPTGSYRNSPGFARLNAIGPDFQFQIQSGLTEYIISEVKRRAMPNTMEITLDNLVEPVLMPDFPPISEYDPPRVVYEITADGGPRQLIMRHGSRVRLQSNEPDVTTWKLDARALKSDQIEWVDGGLWVGRFNENRDHAVKIEIAPEYANIELILIDKNGKERPLIRPEPQEEEE